MILRAWFEYRGIFSYRFTMIRCPPINVWPEVGYPLELTLHPIRDTNYRKSKPYPQANQASDDLHAQANQQRVTTVGNIGLVLL